MFRFGFDPDFFGWVIPMLGTLLCVLGYCHRIWWTIRPAPANAFRADFFLIRPSREGTSSCRPARFYRAFTCTKLPPAISWGVFFLHSRSQCEAWHRRQRIAQDFPRCPSSGGSPRCHRWGTLPVTLRHQFAPSLSRLHERHP